MAFIRQAQGGGNLNIDLRAIKTKGYIKKGIAEIIEQQFAQGMKLISPSDKVEIGLAVAELPVYDEDNPTPVVLDQMGKRLDEQASENDELRKELSRIKAKQLEAPKIE